MAEKNICKTCFYNHRTDQRITCDHEERGHRVYVKWNDYEERLETTEKSVRPPPKNLPDKVKKSVAMCNPLTGHCRRDICTFAHGSPEQEDWNRSLRGLDSEPQHPTTSSHLYELLMHTYRQAQAFPLDTSKEIVKLQGIRHLRGAFNGDTVELEIFDETYYDGATYGRVKRVVEKGSISKFLCRISIHHPGHLFPIDKKNPMFNAIASQHPNGWPGDESQNMIFLVSFVNWGAEYDFPLGKVMRKLPTACTLKDSEALLKYVHSVEYSSEEESKTAASTDQTRPDRSLTLYDQAFTIDPEGARNLDDALSILQVGSDKRDREVYQLGVHIANVAKHIQPDTEIDEVAKERGTSVYGGKKGEIRHMLPDPEFRRKLSLIPGEVRDVISVTCNATHIGASKWEFGKCTITAAQIKSAVQLNYEDAQCLIDGSVPSHCTRVEALLSLVKSTKLLYSIATALRQNRLQSGAAFAYEADDWEEANCWQSHLLVEELMILANNAVAERVHSHYPNTALLSRQRSPNNSEKESCVKQNKGIMRASFFLSQHLPDRKVSLPSTSITIPLDSLKLIRKALEERNTTLLAYLLSEDRLYPQLAAVCSKFRSISLRAGYCCTEASQTDSSAYRHHSLCLDKYTHFTSPIRRYIDIEVQRMVLEGMKNPSRRREFSHQLHVELCSMLNAKKRSASDFEKKMKNVKLASKYAATSKVCNAFISQVKKSSTLEVSFPELELRRFSNDLKITNFIYSSKSHNNFTWRLRVTTLQGNLAEGLLKLPNLTISPATGGKLDDTESVITAYYFTSDSSSLDNKRFILSQPASFVQISPSSWLKALEFVKDQKKIDKVNGLLPKVPSYPKSPSSRSLIATSKQELYPFLQCDVKASLEESSILKVWLTGVPGTMREPVISPAIQLVEISPLLRICVQHNSHPAECFSDLNLTQASKRVYNSLGEYVDLWTKVLLAEAAERSVQDCQPVIIREVSIRWPTFKKCFEEEYYVPKGIIEVIFPRNFVDHCSNFFRVGNGDLICIRYGYDPEKSDLRAVYHLVVYYVNEDRRKNTITLTMRSVGERNCRVSEDMKRMLESEKHTCEMQIISLSPSYKRVFRGLQALTSPKSDSVSKLSKNVAVEQLVINVTVEEAIKRVHRNIVAADDLATSISKWAPEPTGGPGKVLNGGQKRAMDMALGRKFQLIQGPPGTGKSVTGAHIAYVFARLNKTLNTPDSHQCVLYCGPSNKAVDVVFEGFYQLLKARKCIDLKILRIYSSAVEREDYPGPTLQTHHTQPGTKCPAWAKPYAMHHMIRERSRTEPELIELVDLEGKLEKMGVPGGKLCNEYRDALKKAEVKFLQSTKFDIIFCTCNEASGVRVRKNASPRQCIIDECGMAYEPETIVPIGLCEHAVLIGDHKQLRPVINYRYARENGLTTSLFERYAEYFKAEYMLTLKTQYRMHKAICAFPSGEFYEGKLKTAESVLNRLGNEKMDSFWPKGNDVPIMFVDVVGAEGLTNAGSSQGETKIGVDSKYNIEEAKLVVEIAKILHTKHEVPVENIVLMTPYSAQRSKLQGMVKNLPKQFSSLKVASITESQGDEYEVVILSTVRSQPLHEIRHKEQVQPDGMWKGEHLGFITDKHQINVGITRSKSGLIITGNKTLLEYDGTWERLLQHYDERGCVVDASRFTAP